MKIIAEVGSNFKSLDDCINATHLAKSVGADAVKFQLYTHDELYGYPCELASHTGIMPKEWLPKLSEKAKAVGIEFMCTPFSVDGVTAINPYVETHKLASSEMCHVDMLAVLMALGKPLYISTGGQSLADIAAVAELLDEVPGRNVTFLYCEAAYPSTHVDMRKLSLMDELVGSMGFMTGFSDHSKEVYSVPMLARDNGALVLEKHFNPFNYTDTPDAPHALNVDDFKAMVHALQYTDEPRLGWVKSEQDMVFRHKRRAIVTADIKPGDTLTYNQNFGLYRSKVNDAVGAHPATVHLITGRISKVTKAVGEPLALVDCE